MEITKTLSSQLLEQKNRGCIHCGSMNTEQFYKPFVHEVQTYCIDCKKWTR